MRYQDEFTVKGRKELKHAISQMDYTMLRNKLQHVMKLDAHAGGDGKYLIRSVYFDNFENKILNEKKEGYFKRDKYRVRIYDHNSALINLEKKSKRNNLTFKEKCLISSDEYESMRIGQVDWMEEDERQLIRELFIQMSLYQLKPMTVVDYVREAYVYPFGNVRVTFDGQIKTSFRNTDIFNPDLPMVSVFDPTQVILEVKYDEYLPDVIKMMLQMMDRRPDAYSKYQLSRMYG
ncbi:polyphosphate polymerase domain-containing protein [Viridibacillus arvi]|uniref:polyphosphate polymerase domain-containing protein n=1 Tax=Viridibacillus arvi TaxID=263475 RepID=UPI0034CD680C